MTRNNLQVELLFQELKIVPFEHKTKYYETDEMGVIHHSNYIKWMEEARMDLLEQIGMGYKQMEKLEIITPIVSEKIEYHSVAHFDDTIVIHTKIIAYENNQMTFEYRMFEKAGGEEIAVAQTTHCFMSKSGQPISLNRVYPEIETSFFEFN